MARCCDLLHSPFAMTEEEDEPDGSLWVSSFGRVCGLGSKTLVSESVAAVTSESGRE